MKCIKFPSIEQFRNVISNVNPERDIKKLGDVIRWVVNDVVKEEMDTMTANGIEPKEVNGKISAKVRQMFLNA